MTRRPSQPAHDLTLRQVCEDLGVGVRAVLRLIDRGVLTAYRVGRQWRVQPQALAACKSRLTYVPADLQSPALEPPRRLVVAAPALTKVQRRYM